jgi:anthranilate phosphoribosyltransferase
MNAAAALRVGGMTENVRSAVALAAQSIDSGAAAAKLNQLIDATKS